MLLHRVTYKVDGRIYDTRSLLKCSYGAGQAEPHQNFIRHLSWGICSVKNKHRRKVNVNLLSRQLSQDWPERRRQDVRCSGCLNAFQITSCWLNAVNKVFCSVKNESVTNIALPMGKAHTVISQSVLHDVFRF